MAREKREKKKVTKKQGCLGCLTWVVIIGIAFLVLGALISDPDDTDTSDDVASDEAEEVVDEPVEQEEELEVVEEEPVEEEPEEVAEEEPEEEPTILSEFDYEVIDGVDVYTMFQDTAWSTNSLMRNFSMDSVELLQTVHENLENGIVFRLATTMVDGYGNETDKIVANVWYSQDTVERINYDNWPVHGDTMAGLYDTADGVRIYFALVNDIEQEQKPTDNAPQVYYDSINMEYGD